MSELMSDADLRKWIEEYNNISVESTDEDEYNIPSNVAFVQCDPNEVPTPFGCDECVI